MFLWFSVGSCQAWRCQGKSAEVTTVQAAVCLLYAAFAVCQFKLYPQYNGHSLNTETHAGNDC